MNLSELFQQNKNLDGGLAVARDTGVRGTLIRESLLMGITREVVDAELQTFDTPEKIAENQEVYNRAVTALHLIAHSTLPQDISSRLDFAHLAYYNLSWQTLNSEPQALRVWVTANNFAIIQGLDTQVVELSKLDRTPIRHAVDTAITTLVSSRA